MILKKIKDQLKKENFCPSFLSIFFNPFYFARKGLYESILDLSKNIKGSTLDIGCGSKPYEILFSKASEYIGMDVRKTGHDHKNENIDIYYDGKRYPFKKERFDTVVSFEVFEHVFNPDDFLKEVNRVLKKDGLLLMTVPFIWDEHEQPYDYARYTSYGLVYLLKKHKFDIIEKRKSINDFRIIFQLINLLIYKKIYRKKFYLFLPLRLITNLIIFSFINLAGLILAGLFSKSEDLYLDNVILAKKRC